ncbi:MAG TPA: ATP-binding protein [Anaeromyxobacter sp.]|nr:ATP-binding protein [Anaeromyxobacter sp.]
MRIHTATIPAEMLKVRPRDAFYARQKHLFALAFALVAVLPLVVLHQNASRFYRDSWVQRTSLALAGMARDRRQLVDQFLRSQEAALASVVELHAPGELGPERLETLFRALNASHVITDLGVVDRTGEHLAYVGPFRRELAGRNYADAEWFAEVTRSGRYVSDVFPGYRRVPHLVVAVADARRQWILRATLDSAFFNGLVASADVGPGGDAFIVNRRGELQTPSRHGHDRIPAEELARLAALADGVGGAAAPAGSLHAAVWANGGNWLLVLETDVDASLAGFHRARRRNALLIAAAAAALVLVAVLVTRAMVDRLARAERERQALTDRVREVEKMALVGRLAASVSHEINNPLQIISEHSALVDELLDDAPAAVGATAEECRRSVRKIRDQVRRATAITRRLLGFARPPDPERAPLDPSRTVEEAIALVEADAERHRVAIVRDYAPDVPPVLGDACQLQQVFLNVLGNAIDAIGEGGEIRVATRGDGASVWIRFLDTGPGLSDEARARLFDPFFTTKPRGKGTGLGLYVSHAIVERLGGELTAANRAEGGCAFAVRLPAAASAAAAAPPAGAPAAADPPAAAAKERLG